jgi:uncharacterized membrane protein YqjE
MNQAITPLAEIKAASKRIVRGVLDIGENRLELLVVEVQEACERLLHTILFALGAAVFALLAGMTLTAGIVVLSWNYSPILALAILTVLYGGSAAFLYVQLGRLRLEWQAFAGTLEQLQKDREGLVKILE